MATSYSNFGGQGIRTDLITVTTDMSNYQTSLPENLVDGSTVAGNSTAWSAPSSYTVTDHYMRFDFGSGQEGLIIIDEITHKQSNSATKGVWKFQGSDDASTWTDIGTSFTLGGSTSQVITAPSGNTTGYRYYQLLGISGTDATTGYWTEMEFKIDGLILPDSTAKVIQSALLVLQKVDVSARVDQMAVLFLARLVGKRIITQIDTGSTKI